MLEGYEEGQHAKKNSNLSDFTLIGQFFCAFLTFNSIHLLDFSSSCAWQDETQKSHEQQF